MVAHNLLATSRGDRGVRWRRLPFCIETVSRHARRAIARDSLIVGRRRGEPAAPAIAADLPMGTADPANPGSPGVGDRGPASLNGAGGADFGPADFACQPVLTPGMGGVFNLSDK